MPPEDDLKASDTALKQEIDQIKRRMSSLEKAFDSVLTKDDSEAIQEARQDLAHGQTVTLSEVKKRRS
jgi:predicted  nucleic acid-binding Zn-ribbon protein